jgi:glycerol-3-phosphate O-acyltransferase
MGPTPGRCSPYNRVMTDLSASIAATNGDPDWPVDGPEEGPVVVLADTAGRLERGLVEAWVELHRPPGSTVEVLRLAGSRRRRFGDRTDPRLATRLTAGDDPWVLPVRPAWFPHDRNGRRSAGWIDVLKLGDPRDPDALRQRVILARWPERQRIVVGPGARASTLLTDYEASVEVQGLVDFVTRRAWRALDISERRQRGNRYKVPKFVAEDILARGAFRDRVVALGAERGMPAPIALNRARRYLSEVAATHSPFVIDLIANAIHWLYRQGYGAILYDREQVRQVALLASEHPVAFLPSHRSNLDRLSLQYLLWENDLPPNHTAAGINMNFFPVGPLIRRTGAFFIRRSFKDNELYKFVLRSYLDYLVEKRFPLEWYMEGGRSRSGKLLPPRYGIMAWMVDAVNRGASEDLYLIPTTIVYDQLQDVADYAAEARGREKRKESFGWVLSAARSLRRRYGNIHVRFGEPISVAKEVPAQVEGGESSIEVQKLAFEVMYRIGQITPVTPTALVAIALLEEGGRGASLDELAARCALMDAFVEGHGLPSTERIRLEDRREVAHVLTQLEEHGSVSTYRGGTDPVFYLTPEQAIRAAYYRNTVVHFFVPGAIAELALLAAIDGEDTRARFWDEVDRLRDLFKFEFFFAGRERFADEIGRMLADADPDWEMLIASGPDGARRLLERTGLLRAHWALLPFLDSYQVVGDQLLERTTADFDEKAFLQSAMRRGEQYRLQQTVTADESVSLVQFTSALRLARNRDLIDGGEGATPDRLAFADEIRTVRSRALQIGRVAADRRS